MKVTLDQYQLRDILEAAVSIGVERALIQSGMLKPYLTQSSAYKMYGRRVVEAWIKDGKITAHKSGNNNSKVLLDRSELKMLVKSNELIVYFKQAA